MSSTLKLLATPPLENGDRLTRPVFEARYAAMPNLKKAELIEGIVHMASPLHAHAHGKPHAQIMAWLGVYAALTSNVEALDNPTVRLDADNEPQPDAILRVETGGQSSITPDDYVDGAPELVVEIAASSVSIDLHQKRQVYRRNQVQEYVVWRVYDQELDWFRLDQGEYVQLDVNEAGLLCSQVFPGLWLDRAALLAGEMAQVLTVVQAGVTSQEE
ncbi:MAG: Uma2 family endonuclease [Spirulinaceae cyanobacterium]